MSVRVRFAPSPTGYVHIGSLRTALYDYLYAKQTGGKYIVRVEDTDRTRLVDDAIQNLIEASEWAGIMHDEGPILEEGKMIQVGEYGPYIQSERLDIYRPYVEQLLEQGDAYYCFCSKERLDKVREDNKAKGIFSGYDGHCRDLSYEESKKRAEAGEAHVVRLKLPENTEIEFDDLVRGTVKMNTDDSDDQVLLKADGYPTYHMAVVVDDQHMGITHIIRGEEWLPSTPKHIVLYNALGWDIPKYVHLPNILNIEKKKLSKRHGDVAVKDFKAKGYLPEALINFIALVGWSPENDKEIMTMEEMIESFSFDRVSKSGGVFDVNKLNWMNNHYIKEADNERLFELSYQYFINEGLIGEEEKESKKDWIIAIISLVKEKVNFLQELPMYAMDFVGETFEIEEEETLNELRQDHVAEMLKLFSTKLNLLQELTTPEVKAIFKEIQKEMGVKGKKLFMPMRIGITGHMHGSDLVESIKIMGSELVEKRIEFCISKYL